MPAATLNKPKAKDMLAKFDGVPLEREPADCAPAERCCFCRAVTPFWTALNDRAPGGQVACCKRCAKRAEASDVPSKQDWCRRESIASLRHGFDGY